MIRALTDTVGTSGTIQVWPDTNREEVTAWLEDAYQVDQALADGHLAQDDADQMRDAIDQVADWASGGRQVWDQPHEAATYLGLHLTAVEETDAVSDASEAVREATAALHATCRRAVACGATKRSTASAAGITRQTLDRWLAEETA